MSSSLARPGTATTQTDANDRKKRASYLPAPSTSNAAIPSSRRQPPKKLSKASPRASVRPAAEDNKDAPRLLSQSLTALIPPAVIRTPSLVSGSSVTSVDSPRSNILRRKPSTIGKYVSERSEASVKYQPTSDDAVFGISMPTIVSTQSPIYVDRMTSPPQIDRTHWNASQPISLSSLGITSVDTPLTRFTESPFSHTGAPSSRSSVSPSIAPVDKTRSQKDVQYGSRLPSSSLRKQSSELVSPKSTQPSRRLSTTPYAQESKMPTRNDSRISKSSTISLQPRADVFSKVPVSSKTNTPPELAHLNASVGRSSPTQMSRFQHSQLPQRHSSLEAGDEDLSPPIMRPHSRAESRGSVTSTASRSLRDRLGFSRPQHKAALEAGRPAIVPAQHNKGSSEGRMELNDIVDGSKVSVQPVHRKASKFGFLSRKSKSEVTEITDKPKREPRKGPAAGTGHERYGKFGFRGRSGSTTSASDTRSPSTGSQKSGFGERFLRRKGSSGTQESVEMDDFLKERLKPKVLRGSGGNFPPVVSSSGYSTADEKDGSIFEEMDRAPSSQSQIVTRDLPSEELAQCLPSRNGTPAITAVVRPPVHHIDAEEGFWLRPLTADKATSKWNFLQRARSSPHKKSTKVPQHQFAQFDDDRKLNFDNAAHHALLHAVEPVSLEEVEELVASPSKINSCASSVSSLQPSLLAFDGRSPAPPSLGIVIPQYSSESVFRVSPVSMSVSDLSMSITRTSTNDQNLRSPSPVSTSQNEVALAPGKGDTILVHTPELASSKESPRLPRLSPVGRIPLVKSGRDRDRTLPNASFSRPFAQTQPRPTIKPPGALYSQIRDVASPTLDSTESVSAAPVRRQSLVAPQQAPMKPSLSHSKDNVKPSSTYPGFSMFSFPSRKNSDFSYTSSSDSFAAFAYGQAFEHEDIWHEYNDLLDSVDQTSRRRSHRSSTNCSSQSITPYNPFKVRPMYLQRNLSSPPPEQALPSPPKRGTPSIASSMIGRADGGEQFDASPESKRHKEREDGSGASSRDSQLSSRSRTLSYPEGNVRSSHTSFSSGVGANRKSRVSMISIDDDGNTGVHPSVSIHFEALMTSKWLSFGRVLFSPANNEMKFADNPTLLIMDGLSDEWSYFVAMTYPQAIVYNLELNNHSGERKRNTQSLPNYKKIYHTALGASLPFPKGFFTAAVLRFPIATTDNAYHNTISEFKRVLRPGGFLEVSVLDIDLRGMGGITRKAIRGLKTRMQQQQESISLRSLTDFVLQSIGKRGFEEVQRCIVGVPVVSRGVRMQPKRLSMNVSTVNLSRRNELVRSPESGLHAPGEESDEEMTRKVARVGRWWYSMCYERAIPKSDQSIWRDDALLQECYENGTSFQMLMCHAQKPVQLRRHTRSV